MGHDHARVPGGAGLRHRRRLVVVLAISVGVLVVQAVVALVTGSLALLADAAHMFGDSLGLVLALAAMAVAQRGGAPGSRRTFGHHRVEVLAAGVNGLLLLGLSTWILVQAIGRLGDAPPVAGAPVLAAGTLGLAANVVGLMLLRAGAKESLNVRGAYLEVVGDALGSVAVIASAVIILVTGWHAADPVASLLIAALIVPRALSLLGDVGHVLLEGSPEDVDLAEVRSHILGMEGVVDVHDLHVWTITSGMPVMSAHVVVEATVWELDRAHATLDRLRDCLADHFDVEHSTFQLEPAGHADSESHAHH